MRPDPLRRLKGWYLIGVGVTFIAIAWYGYFTLENVNLGMVVIVSLAFGSGVVVGIGYLTDSRNESRSVVPLPDLPLERMSAAQCLTMAGVTLVLAITCLWAALDPGDFSFLDVVLTRPLRKALLFMGFVLSSYAAIRYLLEAWRRSP